MIRACLTIFIAIVEMVALPGLQGSTPQPLLPTQPVVLVVRDGTGVALSGVVIDIARLGPPDEPYGKCTTDQAGECHLLLPPAAYVLLFRSAWGGQPFVDSARQNAGPIEAAGELLSQGFAIQVDLSSGPSLFLFVIGREASGELVPLWDNAADQNANPQPYLAPGQAGSVQLDSLSGLGSSGIEPTAIASRQVVVSGYSADATATPTPIPVPDEQASAGMQPNILLPGLLGLGAIAAIVVAFLWLARNRKQAGK